MQKTDTGLTAHAYIPCREEKCIPFNLIKTVIRSRWASSCFRTLASKPSIRTSGRWHLRSNSTVSPPYGCFHKEVTKETISLVMWTDPVITTHGKLILCLRTVLDQWFLFVTYSTSFSWLWSWNTFLYCSVGSIGMNPNTCTHISQGFVNPSNNNHLPQNARIHFSIKAKSFAKQRKTINTDKNILPSPCAVKSQTNNSLEAKGGGIMFIYHLYHLTACPNANCSIIPENPTKWRNFKDNFTHVKLRQELRFKISSEFRACAVPTTLISWDTDSPAFLKNWLQFVTFFSLMMLTLKECFPIFNLNPFLGEREHWSMSSLITTL